MAPDKVDRFMSSKLPPKETEEYIMRQLQSYYGTTGPLPSDAVKQLGSIKDYFTNMTFAEAMEMSKKASKPKFPPLDQLPCANVRVENDAASMCSTPGTSFCGKCKLVAYCSKECQTAHWKQHKSHCRNIILLADWRPKYEIECRDPTFIKDEEDPLGIGLFLWAKLPARDLFNLPRNEKALDRDLNIALIASGDLANVVKTIVDLPEGYRGKLNVLVNDFNSVVFYRNILILLILTKFEDERLAVDIALHLWYSVLLPAEYRPQMASHVVQAAIELQTRGRIPLGPTSNIGIFSATEEWLGLIQFHLGSQQRLTARDVQAQYAKVRWQPSRADYRERQYAQLRPSHRVAFQEYRQYGHVLPFGAAKTHFNAPNFSLFSPDGRWLLTDASDPLNGYNVKEVIQSGIAHGCRMEDIYGCLYFHISDQLHAFARRIKALNISFHLSHIPPQHLAESLRKGMMAKNGLPPTIKFDRIYAGNTLDDNYLGVDSVLTEWKPFLAQTKHASIVGCFLNWQHPDYVEGDSSAWQPTDAEASLAMATSAAFANLFDEQSKAWKYPALSDPSLMTSLQNRGREMYPLFLDNSRGFRVYLGAKKLDKILQRTQLVRRVKHKIFPHRLGVEIDGPENETPHLRDGEDLYTMDALTQYTWSERFVEFCHA